MYIHTKQSLGVTWFFDIHSSPSHRVLGNLFRLSQTDGVVTDIIDTVPAAQEGITQDSKGTHRLGEVHAHEAADAGALDLQDVVVGANSELVTTQGEGEVGQRVTLVALDTVLTSEALSGTDLLVPVEWVSEEVTKTREKINLQQLGHGGGQGNEGGTSVQNDTSVLKFSNVVAKGNGVEFDLPVGLAAERDLDQLASVVALVDTTKGSDGVIAILVGVAKVESEHRLIHELLVDHVIEGRNHLVHGDGIIAKAENTIKATEGKSQTRLIGSFGEVLSLDLQVTDLEGVLRHEAAQAARSIANLKLGAILLVGARRRRVILAVEEAGNRAALRRRDPQVGATGVKDNLEGLGRGTNRDLGEV